MASNLARLLGTRRRLHGALICHAPLQSSGGDADPSQCSRAAQSWFDTGNLEEMRDSAQFAPPSRPGWGKEIGCVEDSALGNGQIDDARLETMAEGAKEERGCGD